MWVRTAVLPAPPPVLDIDPEQFLIVGHRGACASAVENTIESYERMVEIEGADAVEVDLCVTKDGQVVAVARLGPGRARRVCAPGRARRADVLCRPVVPPEVT